MVHLRLPFQLSLAPIFLWGIAGGGAPVWHRVTIVFIALHLLLYPGVTAYNSVYDRDTGPVGGLLHPPSVDNSLLHLSIVLQVAGLALISAAGLMEAAIYCLYALLALFYSHPRTRWKSRPLASICTVAVGQGGLAFVAGLACSGRSAVNVPFSSGLPAVAGAMALAVAFYPLTQLYQIAEDRLRGDRTIALVLGPIRTLRLSRILLLIGGALITAAAMPRSPLWLSLVPISGYSFAALWLGLAVPQDMLEHPVELFRRVWGLQVWGSLAATAWIIAVMSHQQVVR